MSSQQAIATGYAGTADLADSIPVMIFNEQTITRLLGSIEANNLVLLCGAGLSIPPPSNLMSAAGVSRACYDKYHAITVLPAAMREAIDQLAGHFYGTHEFESVFIRGLVPWGELVGEPNEGHAAVSDLLISRAAEAALSANFDPLIEQWAMTRKIDMRGALDGPEAMAFQHKTSPLLKFHGCMHRLREQTLWTQAQLGEPQIEQRIQTCANWMRLLLPGKDLLVVGFWTDWGYLNEVLAHALNTTVFGSVTVVDPASGEELQEKAPLLWATLNPGNTQFQHIRASGATALAELRVEFSKVWLRKFFALARPLLEAEGNPCNPVAPELTCDDLYNSRRDGEGVPYNRAAQTKSPPAEAAHAAFVHHLLLQAGATHEGRWYIKDGKRIRVVHGAGAMNSVRQKYNEPPRSGSARHRSMRRCDGLNGARESHATWKRPKRGSTNRWRFCKLADARPSTRSIGNMTDLKPTLQALLQDAGYQTWFVAIDKYEVVAFEDDAAMGFACIFESGEILL